MDETPTRNLASFAARLRWENIPDHVRLRVKDILLDALASGLAGHGADETRVVLTTARELMSAGDSTVLGSDPLSLAGATMANGYLISAVSVCDVHRPTLCHVTPGVVPPVLAVAEKRDASGRELGTAIATGLEITTRVGLGLNYPVFRARGWHSPGVAGPFGAAAATGNLLELGDEIMVHALGIAGSQSAGSFAQLGSPTIKFSQARGALAGLLAAYLARAGFTSTEEILLHPDGGLFRTHSDGGDPKAATRGLGERWELENISLRKWPVGAYLQSVVSVLLPLVGDHDVKFERVRRLRVTLSPEAFRLHGSVGWADGFRARLSARYLAAVVVHDRRCWLDQFTAERITDRTLGDFARERVNIFEDAGLGDTAVSAELELADGTSLTAQRQVPRGDAADPLTRAEIADKFRKSSAGRLEPDAAAAAIEFVDGLERQPSVRPLLRLLAPNADLGRPNSTPGRQHVVTP